MLQNINDLNVTERVVCFSERSNINIYITFGTTGMFWAIAHKFRWFGLTSKISLFTCIKNQNFEYRKVLPDISAFLIQNIFR